MTDASCNKYRAIYVTIDEVQACQQINPGNEDSCIWEIVGNPEMTYNLLELINGITVVLAENELEPGIYKQLRLIIGESADNGLNLDGVPHPYANYLLFEDVAKPAAKLKIPSGTNTGIKLVHPFEVIEDRFMELILDFDACRSVVEAGKSGKYNLKPTIKVVDTLNTSAVYGQITDSETGTPLPGAMISAQLADQDTTTVFTSTIANDSGRYHLLLPPGSTYTLVATSNIKETPESPSGVAPDASSEKEAYLPACATVSVLNNVDIEQNFKLKAEDKGTVFGKITVEMEGDPDQVTVNLSFRQVANCSDSGGDVTVEVFSVTKNPVFSDTDGYFVDYSVDLPIGKYTVMASADEFNPDNETADLITTGYNIEINLALTKIP
jgi:hypothetical protein